MTSRGLKEKEFEQIGLIIAKALKNHDNQDIIEKLKEEVLDLTSKYPLWY